MTSTMPRPESPSLGTRPSLIAGLKAGDEDRWQEFFRTYGPVIRGFALKAGLTEAEADEVMQETSIGVARNVEEFRYDPRTCRFKTWLLNQASWRVKNQFAKRQRWEDRLQVPKPGAGEREAADVSEVAGADPWGALWEGEWQAKLLEAALATIRLEFSATQFQIFDLNVLKEWPASDVAKALGVSMASVYLAKHRVSVALKKESARLEDQWENVELPT